MGGSGLEIECSQPSVLDISRVLSTTPGTIHSFAIDGTDPAGLSHFQANTLAGLDTYFVHLYKFHSPIYNRHGFPYVKGDLIGVRQL